MSFEGGEVRTNLHYSRGQKWPSCTVVLYIGVAVKTWHIWADWCIWMYPIVTWIILWHSPWRHGRPFIHVPSLAFLNISHCNHSAWCLLCNDKYTVYIYIYLPLGLTWCCKWKGGKTKLWEQPADFGPCSAVTLPSLPLWRLCACTYSSHVTCSWSLVQKVGKRGRNGYNWSTQKKRSAPIASVIKTDVADLQWTALVLMYNLGHVLKSAPLQQYCSPSVYGLIGSDLLYASPRMGQSFLTSSV